MEILPSLGMEEKENGDSTITSITNDHITLSISDIKHDNETVPGICLICLCEFNPTEDSIYTLPCTHKYCLTCLESYLESNILEGRILVKCFHIENYGDTTDGKTLPACNTVIPESCVKEILMNKPDIFAKYTRFSFLKSNVYARECPSCLHLQLGDPKAPQMSCESCGTRYCLTHALAHPETMTCAAYEQSIAAETQVNVEAITLISKPCPGCGIFVSKSDGCNHMKVFIFCHPLRHIVPKLLDFILLVVW